MSLWATLGIEATGDERAIKRAYAKKLKVTRPEDDPAAFQVLNDAYQTALRIAVQMRALQEDEDTEDGQEEAPLHEPEPEPEDTLVDAPKDVLRAPPTLPARPAPQAAVPAGPTGVLLGAVPAPPPRLLPADIAQRLWQGFLAHGTLQPRVHLKLIAQGEPMLNLDVADQFELAALRYCASDDCSDALRIDVTEHFGWKSDMSFVRRQLPEHAANVRGRLLARESMLHFLQQADSSPEVNALLNGAPRGKLDRSSQRTFTLAMRRLLASVREHHPHMLLYQLDPAHFAAWETRVEQRRYFRQTAYKSFFAGVFIVWPLMFALLLPVQDHALRDALSFILAQAVAFGLGALIAFKGAPGFVLRARAQVLARFEPVWYDWRFRPATQWCSLALFGAAGLLLFWPDPAASTLLCLDLLMLLCLAVCSYANSADLNRSHFMVWGVLALLGAAVATGGGRGLVDIGYLSHAILIFLTLQLCVRGADYLALLKVAYSRALLLRSLWLVGTAAMLFLIQRAHLPASLLGAALWLWLVGGALLSRLTLNRLYFLLGLPYLARMAVSVLPAGVALDAAGVKPIAVLISAAAIHMLLTMSTTQHRPSSV